MSAAGWGIRRWRRRRRRSITACQRRVQWRYRYGQALGHRGFMIYRRLAWSRWAGYRELNLKTRRE